MESEKGRDVDDRAAVARWELRVVQRQQVSAEFPAKSENGAEVYLNDLCSTHHATLTKPLNPLRGIREKNTGTHLIPILVWEFLTGMPPLDPCAVEQDLRLDALACQCRDNALDSVPIRQLCHMDGGFPANAVDDFIARCRVGLVSLSPAGPSVSQSLNAATSHRVWYTYLDQHNISSRLCQGKGHRLTNASSSTSDHRGQSAQGKEGCD